MLIFWLSAAVLVLAALAFIWIPLRRHSRIDAGPETGTLVIAAFNSRMRELETELAAGNLNTAEYQGLKLELERNLLLDAKTAPAGRYGAPGEVSRRFVAIVSAAVILCALGFYQILGGSDQLSAKYYRDGLRDRLSQAAPENQLAVLQQAWRERPDDIEIGYALAQDYMRRQMFAEAGKVYEDLLRLTENNPFVMAEYAQALFVLEGNLITPQIHSLSQQVLAAQPENPTALSLLGIHAFQQKDYAVAISFWQQVLTQRPEGAGADAMRAGIARARALMGEEESGETQPVAEEAGESVSLLLDVSLDPSMQAKVSPDDTVFVFARAVSGPPMPLAVARMRVRDLPAQVVLDDSMAMTPEAKLSSAQQVELVARVSKSGTPTAQSGDLQGQAGPVTVGAAQEMQSMIKITINDVVE